MELPGRNFCIVAWTAADHFNSFYLFNRQVLDSEVVRKKIHIRFREGKKLFFSLKTFCLFVRFFGGFFFRFLFYFPFDYCAEFVRPFPAKKNECVFHPFKCPCVCIDCRCASRIYRTAAEQAVSGSGSSVPREDGQTYHHRWK